MKLAFSTLGCPSWTLSEIFNAGKQLGFDGIEFRGIGEQLDLCALPDFAPARRMNTRQRMRDVGLHASCMSSSIQVLSSVVDTQSRLLAIETAKAYIDLAYAMGAPFVRVFGGDAPLGMHYNDAEERAAEMLRSIGDYAQPRHVTVVVETHDALIDTGKLSSLIRRTHHDSVQVLWDIHHPYRMAGESVEHTMRNLRGHVRYTHIKDSRVDPHSAKYFYVPTGEGDIPLLDAISMLHNDGYEGYLTLEWEKRWDTSLESPDIIFPHFADKVKAWLGQLGALG